MRPLERRRHSPDYLLISALVLLLGLGLIIIYSISPVLSHKLLGDVSENHFLYGQLTHVGLGTAALIICSHLHYSTWEKILPAILVVSAFSLMLLGLEPFNISQNGATRWVGLGPLSFQPSELLKFALIVVLAVRLGHLPAPGEQKQRFRLVIGLFALCCLLVLFLQRDMGTMLVISAIIAGVYWLAGAPLRDVGRLAAIGLTTGVAAIVLFPHRIARLLTYFDSSQDLSSASYHLNQALIAVGSGGFLGLGVGKSIQVYGYLPEAANDSIFAIVGETLGFVGAVTVILLIGLLIYRGIKICLQAPNRFSQLLSGGVMIWLATQTLVNIGAMLGLVPLTGIPLPFLSYGGTSLVISAAAIGIVINISKYTKRGGYAEDSLSRGRNRGAYNPLTRFSPRPRVGQ